MAILTCQMKILDAWKRLSWVTCSKRVHLILQIKTRKQKKEVNFLTFLRVGTRRTLEFGKMEIINQGNKRNFKAALAQDFSLARGHHETWHSMRSPQGSVGGWGWNWPRQQQVLQEARRSAPRRLRTGSKQPPKLGQCLQGHVLKPHAFVFLTNCAVGPLWEVSAQGK